MRAPSPPVLLLAVVGALVAWTGAPHAQTADVFGRVTDAGGEPLPGANVYLSGTTRGTATDADGHFRIERVELGAYRLVASLLGHETGTRGLRLTASGDAGPFAFALADAVTELGAIRVEARADPVRLDRLRRFRDGVLGETENADRTAVENPYVLAFEERRGTLTAAGTAPLVVVNRALGYRLFFDLDAFEAPTQAAVRYHGEERFEALTPRDAAEAARWRDARARAYRGSLRHLLRALAAGHALADGFSFAVQPDGTDDRGRRVAPRAVHPTEIFRPARHPRGWFELRAEGRLDVTYTGEVRRRGAVQTSSLRLRGGVALVDARGALDADAALVASGQFAAERLPDLVPLGYVPPERGGTE